MYMLYDPLTHVTIGSPQLNITHKIKKKDELIFLWYIFHETVYMGCTFLLIYTVTLKLKKIPPNSESTCYHTTDGPTIPGS